MEIKIDVPEKPILIEKALLKDKNSLEKRGVYVMFNEEDNPIYVGKTSDFARRMREHAKRSKFFKDVYYVHFYEIKDEYSKDIFETFLINELEPRNNISKTYFKQRDYEEELHDIEERIFELKELEYDLNEIISPTEYNTGIDELDGITWEDSYDDYEHVYVDIEKADAKQELDDVVKELERLYKRKQAIKQRMCV